MTSMDMLSSAMIYTHSMIDTDKHGATIMRLFRKQTKEVI